MRLLSTLALLAATTAFASEPEYPKQGPDIYDREADGSTQIAAALTQAKAEHKRVLLKLGANWCVWCHRLSATMHESKPVAQELADNYILVLIDVNHRNGKSRNDAVNQKYGNPVQFGYSGLNAGRGGAFTPQAHQAGGLSLGEAGTPAP